jgi:hypothetical protein
MPVDVLLPVGSCFLFDATFLHLSNSNCYFQLPQTVISSKEVACVPLSQYLVAQLLYCAVTMSFLNQALQPFL